MDFFYQYELYLWVINADKSKLDHVQQKDES